MDTVKRLQENVAQLLERYEKLQADFAILQKEVEELKTENQSLKTERKQLSGQLEEARLAHLSGLSGDQKEQLKASLDQVLASIKENLKYIK